MVHGALQVTTEQTSISFVRGASERRPLTEKTGRACELGEQLPGNFFPFHAVQDGINCLRLEDCRAIAFRLGPKSPRKYRLH